VLPSLFPSPPRLIFKFELTGPAVIYFLLGYMQGQYQSARQDYYLYYPIKLGGYWEAGKGKDLMGSIF
jgi:hypothetical protein